MGPAAIISGVGLTLNVVGQQQQRRATKKQISAENRAREAQIRAQAISQNRERRKQIREARIRAAQITQAGVNQGASQSSAVAGGVADVQTQLASNLSFLDQQLALANTSTSNLSQAAIFQGQAATGQAISNAGASIFGSANQIEDIFNQVKSKF